MFDLILLMGIFVSLLAGQFTRIELINSLANVYVHEFLLVVFILYSLYRFGAAPLINFFKRKAVWIFFLLVVFSFALSFNQFSLSQNGIAALYFVRVVLYLLFGVYFFALLRKVPQARQMVFRFIYTFSVLLLIITAIQYVFFPNFWGLYIFGWDPHLYRASAIYLDVFIAAALYGIFAIFWYTKKNWVLSACFILALILSLSRSAYVGFVVSILYLFVSQKKWKTLVISFIGFIVLIIVMPKPFGEGGNLLRTASIKSRVLDYELGITLWQKKPLFGYGYNRIRFAKEQLGLASMDDKSHSLAAFHSSFMVILVSTGIVGLMSFVYLLISFMRRYPAMRVYLIYLVVMSLFDNVLLHVLVLLPFMFLMAHLHYSSLE
jgi:O-antigen ligase